VRRATYQVVNALLDWIVESSSLIFPISGVLPVFAVLIGSGVSVGFAAGFLVGPLAGVSSARSAVVLVVALLGGFTLLVPRIWVGVEHGAVRWTYPPIYHYQLAAFTAAGLFAIRMAWPVPASLGVVAVGLGVAQVFARTGCLLAGCCHGRPNRCGIRYSAKSSAVGVPASLRDARLFPIQVLEALWLALIVVPGSVLLLSGQSPSLGDAVVWYVISYAAARFVFELARADAGRRYFRGVSEPQWTALGLSFVAVTMILGGVLQTTRWIECGSVVTAGILLIATIALTRRKPLDRDLLSGWHIQQVADAVKWVSLQSSQMLLPGSEMPSMQHAGRTSLGFRIVTEHTDRKRVGYARYTLSHISAPITLWNARALAALVCALTAPDSRYELVRARDGEYDLVIPCEDAKVLE
jgi:Prolipoprotein diacylglyceryl transferase